jgi:HlyD family secretion protein
MSIALKPDDLKPQNLKPEAPQPEPPQPEVSQPEAPQPEPPQPEVSQPEAPQPEPPQPEVSQPELPQPESPRPKRFPKWLIGSVALIAVMGVSYFAYRQFVLLPQQQAKNKVQTAPVERSNLTITVSANGTVQPERSVNVSPKTSGILKQLLVKEGDAVEQGQILAYMDDSNLQGQMRQARGNLAAAEANREKISAGNRQEETAQAKAKLQDGQFVLRQAEADLQRNRSLSKAGAISRQALDVALTARDRAQAQVTQAQEALDLSTAGARPEDIAEAQAQVVAVQGAMQIIQANLNDIVIRAPFSGIVSRKFADPGAFVTPTTAGSSVSSASSSSILSLASTNQIVASVAEANIAQIRLGLTAIIQVDAYTGKSFTGKVSQIATQSVVMQNVTSFEVKVSVADPQRFLKSGMNVNVVFNAGELNNVLVVPTGAIVQQNNTRGVFVAKDKGDPVFVPLTIGATINDKTEVKSGLTGKESVLVSFPPGTRKVSTPNGRP